MTWTKPAALVFGGSDPFVSLKSAFNFLESKRTCMTILQLDAKLGHMPQEDYAEALEKPVVKFLAK
jgi:pimeloyl-ACP methyl ester carboxylesterase